jgi:hypothetical protein
MDGGVADTACCTKAVESAEGRGRSGGGAASSSPPQKKPRVTTINQSGRCKQQKWPDAIMTLIPTRFTNRNSYRNSFAN